MDLSYKDKKIELLQWLSTINDNHLIDKLMRLREKEEKDWWTAISEEEQNAIQKGLDDADNGKLNPHSEAKKIYGKWLHD